MKRVLFVLICLGLLFSSTIAVFAGDETNPYGPSSMASPTIVEKK